MPARVTMPTNRFRIASRVALCILTLIGFLSAGCASKPKGEARRFHLHGKIVSVNLSDRTAAVDHDAIPGFMDAMTMAYPVPDERVLATLSRGDEITADVVVVDTVPHLENIVIVKRASKN